MHLGGNGGIYNISYRDRNPGTTHELATPTQTTKQYVSRRDEPARGVQPSLYLLTAFNRQCHAAQSEGPTVTLP